ncbi:ribonuclease H-like domain-containing protein [Tanacetum coccineum]
MYNFDLKNVVPYGDLTCLFAKATIDESKLWYRRLGHVNFKKMNKLVKGNLVRGLPLKTFESDHTYVACQKGKQHKASFITACYVDDSVDAGQSNVKFVLLIHIIAVPLWSSISLSYKSSDENDTTDDSTGESPIQKPTSENEQALKNVLDKMMDQEKEATKQLDAVRK